MSGLKRIVRTEMCGTWLILIIIGAIVGAILINAMDNSKPYKNTSDANENKENEIDWLIEFDELDENGEPW